MPSEPHSSETIAKGYYTFTGTQYLDTVLVHTIMLGLLFQRVLLTFFIFSVNKSKDCREWQLHLEMYNRWKVIIFLKKKVKNDTLKIILLQSMKHVMDRIAVSACVLDFGKCRVVSPISMPVSLSISGIIGIHLFYLVYVVHLPFVFTKVNGF